jgi:hypothetical protein
VHDIETIRKVEVASLGQLHLRHIIINVGATTAAFAHPSAVCFCDKGLGRLLCESARLKQFDPRDDRFVVYPYERRATIVLSILTVPSTPQTALFFLDPPPPRNDDDER